MTRVLKRKAKSNEPTEEVKGIVVEFLGKNKYGFSDFTLRPNNSDDVVKCSVYGDFDTALVGEDVSFNAVHNEKFGNYTVKGKITSNLVSANTANTKVETATIKSTQVEVERPSVTLNKRTVATDLDTVRDAAEAVFTQDAEFVTRIFGGCPSNEALAAGIQALQAIRATLFIESNRRERPFGK